MRKATGIVRRTDNLGRIVIPMEVRKVLCIEEHAPLEIFTNNDGEIILKKYQIGCISCGSLNNLKQLPGGEVVCEKCLKEAK